MKKLRRIIKAAKYLRSRPQLRKFPQPLELEKFLKGKTILGGPHPTLVHAAVKRGNQRALTALDFLLTNFDTVVAGDGEKAIFRAVQEYGFIDADDPKSDLWVTSKDFSESPFPARHLVDMSSYHYTVDEKKATSMVGQFGCPFSNADFVAGGFLRCSAECEVELLTV